MRGCKYSAKLAWISLFGLFIVLYISLSIFHADSLSVSDTATEVLTIESFNKLANKKDFLYHAEDMLRLQKSINNELSILEQKRNKLKENLSSLDSKGSTLQHHLLEMESSIKQIQVDINNMLAKRVETLKDYPPLMLPKRFLPNADDKPLPYQVGVCKLSSCFDYSRCSILSSFPVYLYEIFSDNSLTAAWKSSLLQSVYMTNNPNEACIFLVLVEYTADVSYLSKLPYWNSHGMNHIVINLSKQTLSLSGTRTMVAQIDFGSHNIQPKFDVSLPHMPVNPVTWKDLPLLLPVRQTTLASFFGRVPDLENQQDVEFIQSFINLASTSLGIVISTTCVASNDCNSSQWCLCWDNERSDFGKLSTFTLIPNIKGLAQSQLSYRLFRAFVTGSIPVVIGSYHTLPFDEIVSWSSAAVLLPKQRITEVAFILRNILEPDIFAYKKNGRNIFDKYFSSIAVISQTLLTIVRTRLDIPALPQPIMESKLIYDENNHMPTFEPRPEIVDEILGPLEPPYPSPSFQHNYTSVLVGRHSAEILYPFTPWDPVLPTDAKFHGSPYGFRPINNGSGGSGKEFSISLGGNNPAEQFTIVVLTYDRPDLLLLQLSQFNNLPYLNKVLVVWNNPNNPDTSLVWPKIHVPIQVIKSKQNSLNNRFIPYKEIETEAILSMDDDMYLRGFEIVFAFRVWRESRDRIVGFPGRYHAWNTYDQLWNYNSNHSCELSMILTGAAFFHKYYAYQYTYVMQQAIRDKVDEFMNCEDIAMNFLVSHITGKPPIKTTSRWTFRCPTCGEASLWIDESHFLERHKCINFFTQVYGYLPLKYTQFRADSVLFKTRLPQDKQKCFTTV